MLILALGSLLCTVTGRTILLKFLKLICVSCSDELAVHVKNLALWVHQELSVVTLDLYPPHDNIVFHVYADLFVISGLAFAICFTRLAVSDIFLITSECGLRVLILIVL